ncbi:ferrous iron transport protein A [bacterium]|nr:ferrous iron transport protein A [bacterium]
MNRLIDVKTGDSAVFVSIEGGCGVIKRLSEMGLVPGETIKVLNGSGIGPVTLFVKGTKLVLGYGLARKIFVKEVLG